MYCLFNLFGNTPAEIAITLTLTISSIKPKTPQRLSLEYFYAKLNKAKALKFVNIIIKLLATKNGANGTALFIVMAI